MQSQSIKDKYSNFNKLKNTKILPSITIELPMLTKNKPEVSVPSPDKRPVIALGIVDNKTPKISNIVRYLKLFIFISSLVKF